MTTLGPGTRAGIWTQGCTLHCRGCLSRDTWEADPGKAVPVEAVLGWLASLPEPVDGVTVSGGEPFQQPAALAALLRGIRAWRDARGHETIALDILVYSGYVYSRLSRTTEMREILDLCDAVITGPYVDRLNPGGDTPGTALYSGGGRPTSASCRCPRWGANGTKRWPASGTLEKEEGPEYRCPWTKGRREGGCTTSGSREEVTWSTSRRGSTAPGCARGMCHGDLELSRL
ncbi:radical SAM protein [Actinomadura madurae]|uniref:4Fe-4S single cluster domain-containing protein n=1 Tax=Actinomadura madurae TaxID=1993 RepID=UPI00202742FC|nr:4Fe-4S single cluster domain-containing protein [Actinomadura madurae]URN01597.1 radical SAM protein [Actinomadura madurae]URN10696.1 radical SAM protein [Actinomadura madurae]